MRGQHGRQNGWRQKGKRNERKEEREIEIALPFLNIRISHSVLALRNMLAKLITGFSWCTEYHVGEEPKSEANCWAEKGPLFRQRCAKAWRGKICSNLYEKESLFQSNYGLWKIVLFLQRALRYLTWHEHTVLCVAVLTAMLYCDGEQKWSEACTDGIWKAPVACICLSARGYQVNFCWLVPRVCEKESKAGDTLSWYPRARDHAWRSWACWEPWGERAPLWCLEGRPHPAAALQATRCLARGRAQMEECVCVSVFTDVVLGYVNSKRKVCKWFNEGEDVRLTCLHLLSHRNTVHPGCADCPPELTKRSITWANNVPAKYNYCSRLVS